MYVFIADSAYICGFNTIIFDLHCLAWYWDNFPSEPMTQNWTWLSEGQVLAVAQRQAATILFSQGFTP